MSKVACVLMASGFGKRFSSSTGQNKLFAMLEGKKVYEYSLDTLSAASFATLVSVTQYDEIYSESANHGFHSIMNQDAEQGISASIRLGTKYVDEETDCDAAMFCVADQPLLSTKTVEKLIDEYRNSESLIVCPRCGERLGNPVIFDRKLFFELMELSGDKGGKSVMKAHLEKVSYIDVDEIELSDIDRPDELSRLIYLKNCVDK